MVRQNITSNRAIYSVVLLLIVLSFWGCSKFHGVKRESNVKFVVDHQCVQKALENIDLITDVSYKYEEVGKGLLHLRLSGFKEPDKYHHYLYKITEISNNFGHFLIITNHKGHTRIHHAFGAINKRPTQSEIDRARPIMNQPEQDFGQCGSIDNIHDIMKEKCPKGIICKPLSEY